MFCGVPTSVLPMAAQENTVLAQFKQKEFVQIRKYRDASKDGHRGESINIVVQQKMAAR